MNVKAQTFDWGRFGGVWEWLIAGGAVLGLACMESCVDWIWR